MFFRQVFEPNLAQYAYIIGCQRTGEAIVVDPMRDIDRYIDIAKAEGLTITAITETHIHADYLSGAREFAEQLNVMLYLSDEGDEDWKYFWAIEGDYNFQALKHKDTFKIGNIQFEVIHSPGHTPEHISFLITDLGGGADEPIGILSGDFVFVGDLGRPDLLETAAGEVGAREPSANRLFDSVQSFLELPEYLQIWPGHGAGSACGKALGAIPESTVGYEKRFNTSIQAAIEGRQNFVDSILDGQPEPPLYFARMKHENKFGPAILNRLPKPVKIKKERLEFLEYEVDYAIVDTRQDRSAFMQKHLPGSIYAPLNKSFPTITGSYIHPETPIYLILDREEDVEFAVRNLVRIGLDKVVAYALPSVTNELPKTTIEEIQISEIDRMRALPGTSVLDVRGLSEFEASHIPEAVNIAHTRLLDQLDNLDKKTTYLVHCRSGARAASAASLLKHKGFDVIYVNGAYADWASQQKQSDGVMVQ